MTSSPAVHAPPPRGQQRQALAAVCLALALGLWPAILGTSALVAAAEGHGGIGGALVDLSRKFATALPLGPLLRLIDGPNAISTGSDGRLTILLLGSDTRGGGIERTDTVMIVSIKGNVISAASIPRDTSHIPNPSGGIFNARINAIVKLLRSQGLTNEQALDRFKFVIENLMGIEIDYYALIKFDGFNRLVDEVAPISVNINSPIRDTRYWDDPNQPSGVYFPAASDYELYAWQPGADPPLCNGLWKSQSEPIPPEYWCRRAMPFVRSRKSSSDFARARRQQNFVIAAIRRVTNRTTSQLDSLRSRAQAQVNVNQLITDIPLTAENALDLYNTLSGASVGFQVVFSPSQYATHIPDTTAYELKLDAVREVARQWFSGGVTPSPGPTPTPGPTSNVTPPPTATAVTGPTPTPGPTSHNSPPPTATAGTGPTATAAQTTTPSGPTASAGLTDSPVVPTAGSSDGTVGPTISTGPTTAGATPSPEPTSSVAASDAASPSPGQSPDDVAPGPTGGTDPALLAILEVLAVASVGVMVLSWLRLLYRRR